MTLVKSDVTIIGGGIIGLCCAYSLNKLGLKVTVVESDSEPRHASWAAAGILKPLQPENYPDAFYAACDESVRLYKPLEKEIANATCIDIGLANYGAHLIIMDDGDHADAIRLQKLLGRGAKFTRFGRRWLVRKYKFLSNRVRSSMFLDDCYRVRCDLLIEGLRKLVIKRSVMLASPELVTKIELRGDKVISISSPKRRYESGNYILSAGPWADDIAQRLRFSTGVKPVRGCMLLATPDVPLREIIHRGDHYLVPRADGDVLIGSTVEDAGFDESVPAGSVNDIISGVLSFAPGVSAWKIKNMWAGLRPKPRSSLPMIGYAPNYRNLLLACGHYRNGITLGPLTGELVASLISGKNLYNPFMQLFGRGLPIPNTAGTRS